MNREVKSPRFQPGALADDQLGACLKVVEAEGGGPQRTGQAWVRVIVGAAGH